MNQLTRTAVQTKLFGYLDVSLLQTQLQTVVTITSFWI